VIYKNSKTKVTIICPIHGRFLQTPGNHLYSKQGCSRCSGGTKLTTEEFIEKARKVHGDRFDYSNVEYKNNHSKICIICPEHGEFWQTPNNHISQKQGCPKCYGNIKLNTNELVYKFKEVHGNEYDYSGIIYNGYDNKIPIICKEHGVFYQTPHHHLQRRGCPKCGVVKSIKNTKFTTGLYTLKYPEKYSGNINEIIYRSSYELKAFQMIEEELEKSNWIILWESESVLIPYELDGKEHKYIVDLKLITKHGIQLIEIKPISKVEYPKYEYYIKEYIQNQAKWEAAKEYCDERNWEFKIWTEKELGL